MATKKLVLAYSGGLDTSYCIHSLSKKGFEVHAVSVNTGGFNSEQLKTLESRALDLGAASYKSINAIIPYYEKVVRFLIFGNVLRNNTYPLSVSAERIIQATEIAYYAKMIGANYVAHGSTGAGNDQVRFDMIFQTLLSEVEIITPIRDEALSREEEIRYLQQHGYNWNWEKAKYSVNQGLWGTSVGGAETLTSHLPLPETAFPHELKRKDTTRLTLEFDRGELVRVDDKTGKPTECIQYLTEIGQEYAIGRDIHIGDTVIGIKGRVGFEAAAPLIIIKAHHTLEKHVLSKWQLHHKEYIASNYGMLLHEGHYLDPVMRDFESFLEKSQQNVNGEVFVRLFPYRFQIEGIKSNHDLMNSSFGSYGEENKGWTAEDAKGFIKLLGLSGKIYERTNQKS